MTERFYWLGKTPVTRFSNVLNHHDLFRYLPVGTGGEHTRAFPEEFVLDMLRCFPDARVILDPYAGSGTVGVGAIRMKRVFIGCDNNPDYVRLANTRIQAAKAQIGLEAYA